MSFVERHGLWSNEQKEAASAAAQNRRGAKTRSHPVFVSRPARHSARQDAGRERGAGLAGERMHHHHHDARQGHLASNGVSGVHRRRRLRHAGDGRRRRRPDGGGSPELSRAAMGVGHRLAVVRRLFRRRPAGAVRDPPSLSSRCSRSSKQRGYDFVAGLEVECHIFKLEDARMSPEDAGQPGQPPSSACCRTAINT